MGPKMTADLILVVQFEVGNAVTLMNGGALLLLMAMMLRMIMMVIRKKFACSVFVTFLCLFVVAFLCLPLKNIVLLWSPADSVRRVVLHLSKVPQQPSLSAVGHRLRME